MLTWADHRDEYLDETLRLEGRGYPAIIPNVVAAAGPIRNSDASSKCVTVRVYSAKLASLVDTLCCQRTGSR